MANLDTFQKELIEKLFQMSSGYVLDFSDRTIADFFHDELNLDIYDEKYNYGSGSKANRLRGFLNEESEKVVSDALLKLLEYIENKKLLGDFNDQEYPINQIEAIRGIASSLSPEIDASFFNSNIANVSSVFNDKYFGLFISHRDNYKIKANELKESLKPYGVKGFVAHEDIEPTQQWQEEIEKALFSMDALIALLSPEFSKSPWTNQEIGVAFGLNKYILTVRLGEDPKGFVGKFQALRPLAEDELPFQILKQLLKNQSTKSKMISSYFLALSDCSSFAESAKWGRLLPLIEDASTEQISTLVESYNNNSQANSCFELNGGRYNRNTSIVDYINNWSGKKRYTFQNNRIKQIGSI